MLNRKQKRALVTILSNFDSWYDDEERKEAGIPGHTHRMLWEHDYVRSRQMRPGYSHYSLTDKGVAAAQDALVNEDWIHIQGGPATAEGTPTYCDQVVSILRTIPESAADRIDNVCPACLFVSRG